MIGSFLGILTAIFLYFNPGFTEKYLNFNLIAPWLIGAPLLFLFLEIMALIKAPSSVQKASKTMTPHLLNLFKKDRSLQWTCGFFFLFFLLSLVFSTSDLTNKNIAIPVWFILLGISFDLLRYTVIKISDYLNPFSALEMFKKAGINDIQNEREIDLCGEFDAITETAVSAIQASRPSMAQASLNTLQDLTRIFLESSKSLGHREQDSQTEALGIKDKVSYTLSYLFQKIDFVFQETLQKKLEAVLSSLVTTLGKITIHAVKCDMTLSLPPLIYLGKFATKSIENKFQDVGVRATLTLLEVAKTIISEIDLTYLEIQETFLCLISQLDNIAKETFKQDKDMKVAVLRQPFLELKELFKTEKMATHRDTPVIVNDLDRVLAEFQILETVMRTIPLNKPVTENKINS